MEISPDMILSFVVGGATVAGMALINEIVGDVYRHTIAHIHSIVLKYSPRNLVKKRRKNKKQEQLVEEANPFED